MDNFRPNILSKGCVATLGFFDGVHSGHRYLIEQVKKVAESKQLPSVVFTFSVHPRKVLHSDYQPQLLTTFDEKILQLQSTGIDTCIVLNFDIKMSELSAYEFLKYILHEKYNVTTLVIGHDHRFGHNRADSFDDYVKYGKETGIQIVQAEKLTTEKFSHISSSEVRNALSKGNIGIANELLSYSYTFKGVVANGYKLGRKIGFPTANVEPENSEKIIPAQGVFAVNISWNNGVYRGMMNIGTRPTLNNGTHRSIEVHIFDFDKNIYDDIIEICFLQKIRDEQKFSNVDDLVLQLKKDKIVAMKVKV